MKFPFSNYLFSAVIWSFALAVSTLNLSAASGWALTASSFADDPDTSSTATVGTCDYSYDFGQTWVAGVTSTNLVVSGLADAFLVVTHGGNNNGNLSKTFTQDAHASGTWSWTGTPGQSTSVSIGVDVEQTGYVMCTADVRVLHAGDTSYAMGYGITYTDLTYPNRSPYSIYIGAIMTASTSGAGGVNFEGYPDIFFTEDDSIDILDTDSAIWDDVGEQNQGGFSETYYSIDYEQAYSTGSGQGTLNASIVHSVEVHAEVSCAYTTGGLSFANVNSEAIHNGTSSIILQF